MKKSRIILPAAALLALSSAAAVTGTVAWFTANRIKTVGFTGITAVNPEQGLSITNAANVAQTTITGDNATGYSVAHAQLRDASYDVDGNKIYGSILDDASGQVYGYGLKTLGTADTKTFDGTPVYFGTQFTMTFAVSREDDGFEQSLLFNEAASSVGFFSGSSSSDSTKSILNALRIGMKCGDEWFVWAPKSDDSTFKYVSSAVAAWDGETGTREAHLAAHETTLTTAQYIKAAGTAIPVETNDAPIARDSIINRTDYLGKLTEAGITVTITTWFEGLDSDCINGAVDFSTQFVASLQFTMRKTVNPSA